MRDLLGAEADAFLAALRAPAQGLRVNTLRLTPAELRALAPFELRPLGFPPDGFTVGGDARPGRHPFHDAGLYYLQDPGAMAVGAMVGARPGERVLDLAAAPGGKASQLAAAMRGEGVLLANDVHPGRARELASNLERLGVRNAIVTAERPGRLAAALGACFDRVLLDAPCSGESMFHKSDAAIEDWSPASVAGCARRQSELLGDAAGLVRPGGLLVYSTCSFSPEENEGVVAGFLTARPDFTLVPLAGPPGAAPAEPDWVGAEAGGDALGLGVRLWPHRVPGAGHFVAGLRRSGGDVAAGGATYLGDAGDWGSPSISRDASAAGGRRRRPRGRRGATEAAPSATLPQAVRAWTDFREAALPGASIASDAAMVMRGEALHAIPSAAPPLDGLRVIAAGIRLGELRRGRFDPSHSLAMALAREDITGGLALDPGSTAVEAYLRGETLPAQGPDGWIIVTVTGFPLGWGKRVAGVVKNHYPKGLRRR